MPRAAPLTAVSVEAAAQRWPEQPLLSASPTDSAPIAERPQLDLVAHDAKPPFMDNNASLKPEHAVLLPPPK
jgi:hypothetical protein